MLCKWFTEMLSEGKPSGPITGKDKPFYDEMKTNDKCTFPEDWLKNLGTV
jgi:hypothetical protein